MVSGIVIMRDGQLGSLYIVPPECKIDTNAWLDVQHVIPECEAIDNFFICILDNALSQGVVRRKHATHARERHLPASHFARLEPVGHVLLVCSQASADNTV